MYALFEDTFHEKGAFYLVISFIFISNCFVFKSPNTILDRCTQMYQICQNIRVCRIEVRGVGIWGDFFTG